MPGAQISEISSVDERGLKWFGCADERDHEGWRHEHAVDLDRGSHAARGRDDAFAVDADRACPATPAGVEHVRQILRVNDPALDAPGVRGQSRIIERHDDTGATLLDESGIAAQPLDLLLQRSARRIEARSIALDLIEPRAQSDELRPQPCLLLFETFHRFEQSQLVTARERRPLGLRSELRAQQEAECDRRYEQDEGATRGSTRVAVHERGSHLCILGSIVDSAGRSLDRTGRPRENQVVPGASLPREFTARLSRPGGLPEEWFLGPLQARILQTLADRGESSVREVFDALPRRNALAYTTVMTVLDHLHKKGIVTRKLEGKGYRYTARFTPDELRDRMARHLVQELVDDFGEMALVHFASALDRIDRRRLARLRRAK
ncbi:MAG TPA: BlaI/MecI/CopY family transcriptional regulator [Candidatus Limnocylindria bacterium]|nr:BlaI/MecI/CopY family transcriptional regulator [Candidatus Limnocylindria bacterium]